MPLCSLSLDLSCRHVVHPMVYSLDYSVFVPADGESRNQQERKKKKKKVAIVCVCRVSCTAWCQLYLQFRKGQFVVPCLPPIFDVMRVVCWDDTWAWPNDLSPQHRWSQCCEVRSAPTRTSMSGNGPWNVEWSMSRRANPLWPRLSCPHAHRNTNTAPSRKDACQMFASTFFFFNSRLQSSLSCFWNI